MRYNVEYNEQQEKYIGTVEGSDSSVVGDTEEEVLLDLSEVAEEWVKYGKARHQAPDSKPHWVGKTPETDEVIQAASSPKAVNETTEAKPKMKKKKVLEILAEYHHEDICQMREEMAVLRARLSKTEAEQESAVNGKAEYNPLVDRTL